MLPYINFCSLSSHWRLLDIKSVIQINFPVTRKARNHSLSCIRNAGQVYNWVEVVVGQKHKLPKASFPKGIWAGEAKHQAWAGVSLQQGHCGHRTAHRRLSGERRHLAFLWRRKMVFVLFLFSVKMSKITSAIIQGRC